MLGSIKLWYIPTEISCQGSDNQPPGEVPTVNEDKDHTYISAV